MEINVIKTKPSMKNRKTVLARKKASGNWLNFLASSKQGTANLVVKNTPTTEKKKKPFKRKKDPKVLALDCEMVADENGHDMLARISIVDFNMQCLYDKYVKPTSTVGDYRTRFSGIRPGDLTDAEDFEKVQQEVKQLLFNKILVGHGLRNDLSVLKFGHHLKLLRDTSLYKPFREISGGKTPSLRKLSQHFLNETIQEGEHSSVVDASAAMKLYVSVRKDWEKSLVQIHAKKKPE